MTIINISPVFYEHIPDVLEEGKIYISYVYKTAIHLCACGCGRQSVTPFIDGEWRLDVDGGIVTLSPSIGNFKGETQYHAHYFIQNNKIIWI